MNHETLATAVKLRKQLADLETVTKNIHQLQERLDQNGPLTLTIENKQGAVTRLVATNSQAIAATNQRYYTYNYNIFVTALDILLKQVTDEINTCNKAFKAL